MKVTSGHKCGHCGADTQRPDMDSCGKCYDAQEQILIESCETDFGLAKVKSEGVIVDYDDGMPGNGEVSETRWIEMCYDLDEDMSNIAMGPIFSKIDKEIADCNYTEDEIYLIIKSIANRYVED